MRAQSEAATPVNFRRALAALFAFAALADGPARAAGGPTNAEWVSSAKSQARLIDAGLIDGLRYAGVEIRLSGPAVTYWRDPGEAGAPPVFDFAGSENLLEARTLYPQPARIDEGGVEAFGYQREVLFPIRVTAREKDRPVVLDLALDYAVCETICLPVHARLRLDLPPAPQVEASSRLLLAEALKTIPRPLDAAQAKAFAHIAPAAGDKDKPHWRLRLSQEDKAATIFVEAPQGFYVESRPAGESNAFVLTLLDHPAGEPLPEAPVRVTVTGPTPVEFELALPHGRN
jgi:DsbC/DsbD-like thiol-disulfide interchange protein